MKSGREFVVTGTQVYGPAGKDSDIDIVMYYNDVDELRQQLVGFGIYIEQSDDQINFNYPGFYFSLGKLRFNIIFANTDEEMEMWETATCKMWEHLPIEDREKRVKLFQKYRGYVEPIKQKYVDYTPDDDDIPF